MRGNTIHDNLTGGHPINYSVEDAAVHLRPSLGAIKTEDSFDLTFTNENNDVPQSSVGFYLQRLVQEPKVTAAVIVNEMTICFVAHGANIVVLDSHQHGHHGALIGSTTLENVEIFLKTVKQLISPNFNMCSLTFVHFN